MLCRSCRGKILSCSTTLATGCTYKSRGIVVGGVQAVGLLPDLAWRFFFLLGLRSAVSEISKNTNFEHGGCFFSMLGLRSAVSERTQFLSTVVVFSSCLV